MSGGCDNNLIGVFVHLNQIDFYLLQIMMNVPLMYMTVTHWPLPLVIILMVHSIVLVPLDSD